MQRASLWFIRKAVRRLACQTLSAINADVLGYKRDNKLRHADGATLDHRPGRVNANSGHAELNIPVPLQFYFCIDAFRNQLPLFIQAITNEYRLAIGASITNIYIETAYATLNYGIRARHVTHIVVVPFEVCA